MSWSSVQTGIGNAVGNVNKVFGWYGFTNQGVALNFNFEPRQFTQFNMGPLNASTMPVTASGISQPIQQSPVKYQFPLDINTTSHLSGYKQFNSRRGGGARAHAGIDLYAPEGSVVRSVGDGVVVSNPYLFYNGTYAIEINHGEFTARYGEISVNNLKAGDKVEAGDVIGKIMVMQNIKSTMLHFEMYSNSATGPLTNKNNKPYKRRSDLINPTNFIETLRKKKFKIK